jgi:uncharacterized protein YfaP (DUF2135 family)
LISPAAIPVTFWNVTGLRPTLITQTIPSKGFFFFFFSYYSFFHGVVHTKERTGAIYTS